MTHSFNCNEVPSDEKDPPMTANSFFTLVLMVILAWAGIWKVVNFYFPQLFQ